MSISVKDFIMKVFTLAGYDVTYTGDGVDEKLVDSKTGRVYVEIDPQFFRPGEVPFLKGNYKKIESDLGWRPEYSIDELIKEMVDYDLILANPLVTFLVINNSCLKGLSWLKEKAVHISKLYTFL